MAPLDLAIVYMFVRRLFTPFEDWPAFQAGVIDEHGNVLIPRKKLTIHQANSFGIFDLIMLNLKKMIEHRQLSTHIASQTAVNLLVKEQQAFLEENEEYLLECVRDLDRYLPEEAPTNAVGPGHIAGVGVGSKGEPPVKHRIMLRRNLKGQKKPSIEG